MNSSLQSADRTTCLKVAAVGLAGAIAVIAVGLNARIAHMTSGPVLKAGQVVTLTGIETSRIR